MPIKKTRKDGSTYWLADYRAYGQRIREYGGATKRDAQNVEARRKVELAEGRWVHPQTRKEVAAGQTLSFNELVDRFLAEYRTRDGNPPTYYAGLARVWRKHFGEKAVRDVSPSDVERMKRERLDEVSNTTVRKELIGLAKVFRWAERRGLATSNPASTEDVERPKVKPYEAGYLTPEQEKALLDAAKPWLRRVLVWALHTGMDRSEIAELGWDAVHEREGYVWAPRGKTNVPRRIYLNATCRQVLAECRKVRSIQGGGRVFLNMHGQPIGVENLKTAVRRLHVRAKVDVRQPFKCLRHTFASRLAAKGYSARAIAEALGHTTASVVHRYMHHSEAYQREMMASLDEPEACGHPVDTKASEEA